MFYGLMGNVFQGFSPEKIIGEAADHILDLFFHGLARENKEVRKKESKEWCLVQLEMNV